MSTLVGNGALGGGYADGWGSNASFRYPSGLVVDPQGSVYVADSSNRLIRKVTSAGRSCEVCAGA